MKTIIDESDYLVTHLGNGKFQVKLFNGDVTEAGPNLRGMIRYTYFENYDLPEIGWEVTRLQLVSDYMPKVQKEFLDVKFKPNILK